MNCNIKNITLFHNNFYYSCDLYYRNNLPQKTTTIIVCHGNYTQGKEAPLIKKLIKKLVAKNYIIFSFDNLLYNKSWKPDALDTLKTNEIDFRRGVYIALEYLFSLDIVDRERVFVLGHSFGGSVSIASGALDERIKGIISISPTHVGRFIFDDENLELYLKENFQKRLGYDISRDTLRKLRFDTNEEHYIQLLKHKPILLLYGSRERFWGYGSWINDYYNSIGETADIDKIQRAGHYFGCYPDEEDESVLIELFKKIYCWVERICHL